MEAVTSSNTSVNFQQTTRRQIPEIVLFSALQHLQVIYRACIFAAYCVSRRSRDSVVGIATGYRLDDRGVGVPVIVGSRIFSSPRPPGMLWRPLNLLSIGYRGFFPGGKVAGA
jgi:hypothetical protein